MSHPFLVSSQSWGTRYQTALNNLLATWAEALKSFEGNRIDMDLFTQEFMKKPCNRPLIRTFIYNIKNDMEEVDVEDMLIEIGKKEKGVKDHD